LDGLEAATSSYVTSAITASSLVTASFSGNTLTFTKGDSSTFGVVIPDISGSTINTGSFATTGSNTFVGQQNIADANKIGFGTTPNDVYINSPFNGVTSVDLNIVNNSSAGGVTNINANNSINVNSVNSNVNITGKTGVNVYGNTFVSGALNVTGSLTASLQEGYVWVGNSAGRTVTVATSSFAAGGTINTGSFATTGSNVFTGDQTFIDGANNFFTITDVSGSMMLVGKSYTSASAHLTSSVNQVNLIIKSNNNTADTVISGSNNIIGNPAAPTAGFRRYYTNANISLQGGAPQISSSMAFSPTISGNNILSNANPITIRGPVSSSAYTIQQNLLAGGTINLGTAASTNFERATNGLNFNQNIINGTVSVTAYKTNFISSSAMAIASNNLGGATTLNADSSSITLAANTIQNSGFVVNNSYFNASATGGGGSLQITQGNGIFGTNTTVFASGSNTTAGTGRQFVANLLAGTFNSASVNLNGDNSNMFATAIIGHGLSVTGSSALQTGAPIRSNTYGSAFFGRYNAQDGNKARTAETVFAIGTGTTTTPKTGFLIDSGSNTFVEGTLNVSGSSTLKGGLKFEELSTGLNDNYIYLDSVNKSTLFIQNTSVSSNYTSGSVLQLTTTTGSNAFGGSGSATFQMDATMTGKVASLKVNSIDNVGSAVQGFADKIEFAKLQGFPNTPSDTFRVDATSIELNGNIKVNTSTSASAGIVSVASGGTTVTNGLAKSTSIILATTQDLGSGDEYPAVVSGKTDGSFTLNHNFGGSLNVAYLIINPL
jgi:hypothetical protein